jgi:hypothetical protein
MESGAANGYNTVEGKQRNEQQSSTNRSHQTLVVQMIPKRDEGHRMEEPRRRK